MVKCCQVYSEQIRPMASNISGQSEMPRAGEYDTVHLQQMGPHDRS